MTPSEAMTLLLYSAACDPTLLPAAETDRIMAANVWAQILTDIPLHQALTAARAHHRTSTHRLTPAHIHAACTDHTRTGMAQQIAATPASPPPQGYRRPHRHPAPATPCTYCGAPPHQPCTQTTPRGTTRRRIPHPSRITTA